MIITDRIDPQKLRELVPELLEVDEPVVNFESIRMPDPTGGVRDARQRFCCLICEQRSERRSRMHPVLLQKVYEGAHFRQKQAVAQG